MNNESKITPEMVEAGVKALFKWSGDFDFERLSQDEMNEMVSDVLRASLKARRKA